MSNSQSNKFSEEELSQFETNACPQQIQEIKDIIPDGFLEAGRHLVGYIGNNYIAVPYCPECHTQMKLEVSGPFKEVFHTGCKHILSPITKKEFENMIKELEPIDKLIERYKNI